MAVGKFALQGQGTYLTYTADKAVDGNITGSVSSGTCAHTTNRFNSWWKVDLGRPYLLTGIKIYNRERVGEFFRLLVLRFTNLLQKL